MTDRRRASCSGSAELFLHDASAATAPCPEEGITGVVDGAMGIVVGAEASTSCESWTVAGSSTLVSSQRRFLRVSSPKLAASVVTSAPRPGCRDDCGMIRTGGAVGILAASSDEAIARSPRRNAACPPGDEKGGGCNLTGCNCVEWCCALQPLIHLPLESKLAHDCAPACRPRAALLPILSSAAPACCVASLLEPARSSGGAPPLRRCT